MNTNDWHMYAMAEFFGFEFVRIGEDGEPVSNEIETKDELVEELACAVATVRNARPYDIETDEEREFLRYQAETHFIPIIDALLEARAEPEPENGAILRLEYQRGYSDGRKSVGMRTTTIAGSTTRDNPDDVADAVIVHLWERAESPEVYEYAGQAVHVSPHTDADSLAKAAITAALTVLIGPKPEGENHER